MIPWALSSTEERSIRCAEMRVRLPPRPALLEAHRRKSRESWRRKQAEKKREKAEKKVEQAAEQQAKQHVSAPPSFTLFV